MVRICLQCWIPGFDPWVRNIPWRIEWQLMSSVLAWRISWTEEPDGLQYVEMQRVEHDLMTNTLTTLMNNRITLKSYIQRVRYIRKQTGKHNVQ